MSDPVTIANLALGHIGKPSITSLTEATAEARECKRFYDVTRRSLLAMSDWTFARRRIALASAVNDFGERWTHKYARPADVVRALRIVRPTVDPRHDPRPIPYEVRENAVFTDINPAVLEYTKDVDDAARFGPLFVEALAFRLAERIARPLTRSAKLTAEMREEFERALSIAISADAAQDVGRYSYDADAMLDRDGAPSPFWTR